MIKIIESKKLEIYLIALVIVSIGVTFIDIPFRAAPLAILFFVVFLLYLLRLIVSFRHWKLSKGISFINAFLNLQLMLCFESIAFTFLNWNGQYIITYEAIAGTQIFIFIIGIFLAIKWRKINKTIYWEYLKENTVKALTGMIICVILFYAYDMPSHFNSYPFDHGFGFSLPRKLF
ncbi:MAG: hypothetical protein Q7U08_06975 [Flavobacteriaceae bacterium]|nr:hypothetical protein [Flavobacteriaceae bacterium]